MHRQAILHLMALLCFALVYWQPAAAIADQQNQGTSNDGKIHYELRDAENDTKEIWLWEEGQKKSAARLTDTEGWGNMVIYFSPDDYWILIQDGGASMGVSFRLFRREKGVTFREMKDSDIDGKAEAEALRQSGFPADQISDHRYARFLCWSPDSKSILLEVHGSGKTRDRKTTISFDWVGAYDIAKDVFFDDLKKFNRESVDKFKP
jgi:hypothetical protein